MMETLIEAAQAEPAAESPGRARRVRRGQVIIFGMWCKGCGLCVEFCPTGVLAFNDQEQPAVIHPEKCNACHWCDTHCPDLAIVVKQIESEGLAR